MPTANITNNRATQVNVIFALATRPNIDLLKADELEVKTRQIFGDTSKPILSKFPDVFLLFDPINQISINILASQNLIVIADNRVTDYSSRDLTQFTQFVKAISDILRRSEYAINFNAWGFNINSLIEIDSVDSAKFIFQKFVRDDIPLEPQPIGASVKLFTSDGDHRDQVQFEPRFEGTALSPTKLIQMNSNSHFAQTSLPDLADFTDKLKAIYNGLPSKVGALFV